MEMAPRLAARIWGRFARGATTACAVWLGSAGNVGAQEIVEAVFEDPTTRYAHGVLGDAVEWGALTVTLSDGRVLQARLPHDRVFEDVMPRLWDVDLDGTPEVVVVESQQSLGAQLAIYDETGKIAATPHIGTSNRWLAPIAAGDLDGDGAGEIAYVDRPHLAKTLRVWRYENGTLVQVTSLKGVSNHRIGWDYIIGGLRTCAGGPEMIVASGDWRNVLAVRLNADALSARALAGYSRSAIKDALVCK